MILYHKKYEFQLKGFRVSVLIWGSNGVKFTLGSNPTNLQVTALRIWNCTTWWQNDSRFIFDMMLKHTSPGYNQEKLPLPIILNEKQPCMSPESPCKWRRRPLIAMFISLPQSFHLVVFSSGGYLGCWWWAEPTAALCNVPGINGPRCCGKTSS